MDVPPDGRARVHAPARAARSARSRTRPTARASSAAAAACNRRRRCATAGAAVGHRRLGARPGGRQPLRGHARARPDRVLIDVVIGVGDDRAACLALTEKYRDRRLADRVFELAWTHSQVVLRQLNASEADAQLYARLAGAVIYAQADLRAEAGVLLRNRRGQSGLWGYAISGDLPIVLLQIASGRQHRPRAPAGAGARLVAPEGPGGRPGDLERGARHLPPAPAGADPGPDRRRRRGARDRPAGRHLRAPCRADRARRPHPAAVGGARRPQRQPRQPGRAGERASRRARAPHARRFAATRAVPARARCAHPRARDDARPIDAGPVQRPRRLHRRRRAST